MNGYKKKRQRLYHDANSIGCECFSFLTPTMTWYTPFMTHTHQSLSPNIALTTKQQALIEEIIHFCHDHAKSGGVFLIHGDAGTGKSVLMNQAFLRLKQRAQHHPELGTSHYFLVNHPEMQKMYKQIAEDFPALKKKFFELPTSFINQCHKHHKTADVIFIDEAHLLLTKADPYNRFRQNNHLQEILSLANIVILVFDEQQTLKLKSYWNSESLAHLTSQRPLKTVYLQQQYRMQHSPHTRSWINAFIHGKIAAAPQDTQYDFRIFDSAQQMYQVLREKNAIHGLCRLLSTYDFPYALNGQDHMIHTDDLSIRWDRYQPNHPLPWAERKDSIDEVGSVYTIQGFDLNYAAVILGPSIRYNRYADTIWFDPDRYEDKTAFIGAKYDPAGAEKCVHIMQNALNVLLTRARFGLYLYAFDAELRQRLEQL